VADSRTDVDSERQAEVAIAAERSAKTRGGTRKNWSAGADGSSKTNQDIERIFTEIWECCIFLVANAGSRKFVGLIAIPSAATHVNRRS
jgi:hypothetical protein